MSKVSVVIPAYNAEKTVEKTVRNVLASTIPLDVWVVDDGSTDSTGDVLENLKNSIVNLQPSTFNLIHQVNQGAYMARLNALKRIATPWFGFVDADDTIEPDMFEKMLAFAEREHCDVVQCGVDGIDASALGKWYEQLKTSNSSTLQPSNPSTFLLPARPDVERQFITPHLVKGQGASFIWNKLYRNQYDFSKFVTFDCLTNFDDMIFNFQFFEKVNRMGFLTDKLYHYATTAGSMTHSYGERQFNDFQSCARFRKARGVSAMPWYWVNLRSGVISVLRSSLPISKRLYWIVRLLGACWF